MGKCAVQGGMMKCSFGLAPSAISPLPISRVTIEGRPAATVMDIQPGANIPPFGMCNTITNPAVAAATAAALGTLTPAPCTPLPVGPWKPGAPRTMIGGKLALVEGSICNCTYGGVIEFTMPGAVLTQAN
jgi:hypothetical protein